MTDRRPPARPRLLQCVLERLARYDAAPLDLRRRAFTRAALALAAASALPASFARAQSKPRFIADPFALGVASGYPRGDGVTLWTRLAPNPFEPDGGMAPENVELRWQVAHDEGFEEIAREGVASAFPETAHALHVEVDGLAPHRWYHYRFIAGDATSVVGRTRTAGHPATARGASRAAGSIGPERDAAAKLRFAIGSCQHYEHGWFVAARHLAGENLDLMVFLGDYIYEGSWGDDPVRRHHRAAEATTLDDYRLRYAQYRNDADLRALHAAVPWVYCWDDHEVDNDYAGAQSEHLDPGFLVRRAAAYRAYFEHQPLPRRMLGTGGAIRMYDRVSYGELATFHLLDDRQYRTPQACPDPRVGGGSRHLADCEALEAPGRTLLGAEQEGWLTRGLEDSRARWNLLAQQTLLAPMDFDPGAGFELWTDGWDGYPASRAALLDTLAEAAVSNPVALGGDIHATCIADVHRDPRDPKSPIAMSEFVGSSLVSQGWPPGVLNAHAAYNPHMHLLDAAKRGYIVFELGADRLDATVRTVDEKRRDAAVATQAKFAVQDGVAGIRRA